MSTSASPVVSPVDDSLQSTDAVDPPLTPTGVAHCTLLYCMVLASIKGS